MYRIEWTKVRMKAPAEVRLGGGKKSSKREFQLFGKRQYLLTV